MPFSPSVTACRRAREPSIAITHGCAPLGSRTAPAGTTTEFVIFNGSLAAGQTNIIPGTYSGTIRVTATGSE